MTRVRYLLLWVILAFVTAFFVAWGIERSALEMEAMQVQTLTELAADSALQAGQGIDDFFSDANEQLAYIWGDDKINGRTLGTYNSNLLIMYTNSASDTKYSEGTLFTWFFQHEKTATTYDGTTYSLGSAADKTEAFRYLYDGTGRGTTGSYYTPPSIVAQQFKKFALSYQGLQATTQIPYFMTNSSGEDELIYVEVPRIALIGAKCIWNSKSSYQSSISEVLGFSVGSTNYNYGWEALEQNNYLVGQRKSVFYSSKTNGVYFLTPSKVGVTYIPISLVENIYQNNLDLIMRYKYNDDEQLDIHSTMLRNAYEYQSTQVENNVSNYELTYNNGECGIVNNGLFTVNKDTSTITNVEYKVIDIFNGVNDDLIEQVYGGYVEYNSAGVVSSTGIMTADKLEGRSTAMKYSTSGALTPETQHYIVVAKVTFTTDVILNHKTAVFTKWKTDYDRYEYTNLNDIVQTTGTNTNTSTNSRKYTYTRYYAVTA